MRELKLKYFIDLVSNISAKAKADAQVVAESQKAMQTSVDRTSASLRGLDSAYMRFAANNATERQIGYMHRLGQGIDQVSSKMRGLAQLTAKGLHSAPGAVAGAVGGFYAAKTMLDKPMDYGLTLARMSNTAFDERNTAGRAAGKAELNASIMRAVREGGGSREAAASALNSLIGSGAMPIEDAKKLLSVLTKGASASGASADQLGAISIRASQTMGIPLSDVSDVLDEANAAGKAGGFELENMAKNLPQAMAAGKQSGLTGRDGFRKIVAMLQASVITAGTKDEAANNVMNWLSKINSADTAKDFQKQGIDLRSELVKGRANGADSADTFVSLVDRIASKDGEYQKLKAQLGGAKTDDAKRQTMSSMADILQGKAIGDVVQDRQALMSLVAVMNNSDYVTDIQKKMLAGKGSLGKDFELISGESSYKSTALGNEKDNAMSNAFDSKSGWLNAMLDGATGLAREFPLLTTVVVGASTALGALGAVAGIFSLLAGRSAGGLGMPGGGGIPGAAGSPGPFPILDGAAPAAAGSALGAAGVAAGVFAGGTALSYGATKMLANNKGMRDAMQFDIGGDGAFAAAILSANDKPELPLNHRGKGFNDPRLLTLSAPSIAEQTLAMNQATKIELGEGKLAIDVRVTDERVSASHSVLRPLPMVRINPGATNPGGFKP